MLVREKGGLGLPLLEPHMLSATDAFPDGTLTQLRSQPMEESNFSDIEDEGSSDDSVFHFSAPAALADGPAVVPATTAATATGRPSAFLLSTHRRRCHLRMALAAELGVTGVDLDYEEMWHADLFNLQAR